MAIFGDEAEKSKWWGDVLSLAPRARCCGPFQRRKTLTPSWQALTSVAHVHMHPSPSLTTCQWYIPYSFSNSFRSNPRVKSWALLLELLDSLPIRIPCLLFRHDRYEALALLLTDSLCNHRSYLRSPQCKISQISGFHCRAALVDLSLQVSHTNHVAWQV